MKPPNYMRLLESQNAKTPKGESLGYLTGILYLAPANEAGRGNICAKSTADCRRACLYTAGRGRFQKIKDARIRKTHFLFDNRIAFIASLRYDIERIQRKAKREGLTPAIRVNGTSDLSWLATQMAKEFPDVEHYNYTKLPKPWQRELDNYSLTFSYSGNNLNDCMDALDHGVNVAVVFKVKKDKPLPTSWNGYPVIDGDVHDLRFLDPKGCVVGLRAKGEAKKHETSKFVVQPNQSFVHIMEEFHV